MLISIAAPAIVEPGENTTTEVPEDGFRFFQTECTAFSTSVFIEQIDIYGRCSLYASNVISNPGPLDDKSLVARNEDDKYDRRTVFLKLKKTLKKVRTCIEIRKYGNIVSFCHDSCYCDYRGKFAHK